MSSLVIKGTEDYEYKSEKNAPLRSRKRTGMCVSIPGTGTLQRNSTIITLTKHIIRETERLTAPSAHPAWRSYKIPALQLWEAFNIQLSRSDAYKTVGILDKMLSSRDIISW